MCGRYSVSRKKEELEVRFSAAVVCGGEVQRYNVAPTQLSAVITSHKPSEIQAFRWGLIPGNAPDTSNAARYINARAETILEKYPFARLAERNRCLVIADGFYEWKKAGKAKVPHHFTLVDNDLFAFAGLWDGWIDKKTGEMIYSFTIITVSPNELVAPVHDRMPAILPRGHEKLWLSSELSASEAVKLLQPHPAAEMKSATVSNLVNSPLNDGPAVLEPVEYNIAEQGTLEL